MNRELRGQQLVQQLQQLFFQFQANANVKSKKPIVTKLNIAQ